MWICDVKQFPLRSTLYVLCVLYVHVEGSLRLLWPGPRDRVAVSSGSTLDVLQQSTSCSQNGSSLCALMLSHGVNESVVSGNEMETCFWKNPKNVFPHDTCIPFIPVVRSSSIIPRRMEKEACPLSY